MCPSSQAAGLSSSQTSRSDLGKRRMDPNQSTSCRAAGLSSSQLSKSDLGKRRMDPNHPPSCRAAGLPSTKPRTEQPKITDITALHSQQAYLDLPLSRTHNNTVNLRPEIRFKPPPITRKSYEAVKSDIQSVLNLRTLHEKTCFDKILLWEQFTAFASTQSGTQKSIQTLFNEFSLDETTINQPPKYGEKHGGTCGAHALWVQQQLKEKGINAYLVVKERFNQEIRQHCLLAVRVYDDRGTLHTLLIDPLQNPDLLDFSIVNDSLSYGTPFKTEPGIPPITLSAFLNSDGSITVNDKNPDGTSYESSFTTHQSVLNILEAVSKPRLFKNPKLPWTAQDANNDGAELATVIVDLEKDVIALRYDAKGQKSTIPLNLSEICSIKEGRITTQSNSPLAIFSGDDFPHQFGVKKDMFWSRLATLLKTENAHHYFRDLHHKSG